MRIVSMAIGLAVGAYITWKVVAPLPASAHSCQDNTDCTGRPVVPVATSLAPRPGLRIALYDPAMEPGRRYDTEAPHAAWVAPVEPGAESVKPATFRLAGLGQPGAHGVCLILEDGKRRCLAFIPEHEELRATHP